MLWTTPPPPPESNCAGPRVQRHAGLTSVQLRFGWGRMDSPGGKVWPAEAGTREAHGVRNRRESLAGHMAVRHMKPCPRGAPQREAGEGGLHTLTHTFMGHGRASSEVT